MNMGGSHGDLVGEFALYAMVSVGDLIMLQYQVIKRFWVFTTITKNQLSK